MGETNIPHARIWQMGDGAVIEQQLENYEMRVVVDSQFTEMQAETRIRQLIERRVLDNGGERPLRVALVWEAKPVLMIDPDGESAPQLVTATAYYFPEVTF